MTTSGYLCVEHADQFRECFLLDRDRVTLGSGPDNLVIIAGQKVAPIHVEVCKTDVGFSVNNLNGGEFFVNDQTTACHILVHGDRLRIGDAQIQFESNSNPVQQDESGDNKYGLLRSLSLLTSQTNEPRVLLQETLKLVFASLKPHRCCTFLFDEHSEVLQKVASISRACLPNTDHKVDEGLLLETTRSQGEPIRIRDGSANGAFQAIGIPIRFQGKLLGGICVENADSQLDSTSPINDQSVDVMTAVCSQLAVAIENLNNLTLLKNNRPLYAVGEALTSLDHQIMNIWQGFHGGVFILQQGLDHGKLDLTKQGWEMVHRDQNRLFELIKDVLSFNVKHEFQLASKDLRQVITAVINEFRANEERARTTVHWTAPEQIENAIVDSDLIAIVIRNLIQNALEACEDVENPRIDVQLSHSTLEQEFEISVTDNGCGISEDRISELTSPFETTKDGRTIGIGLAYAQKCVEKHEGELRVESELGKGSKFTLVLPDKNKLSQTILDFGRAPTT